MPTVRANGHRVDPVLNYKFLMKFSKLTDGQVGFSKISGLKEENEVVEYREGIDAGVIRKLPGMIKYDAVKCESGLADNLAFDQLRRLVTSVASDGVSGSGPTPETDDDFRDPSVTIELKHRGGNSKNLGSTWTLFYAWVSSLEISDFDAKANDVVIETMEVQHEGFFRDL